MLDESFLDLQRAHVSNIKIAIMTIASENLKLHWFVFALDFRHSILPSRRSNLPVSARICGSIFHVGAWYVGLSGCFGVLHAATVAIETDTRTTPASVDQPTKFTGPVPIPEFSSAFVRALRHTEREYEHHTWACHSMRGAYASEDLQSTVPLVWCASSWGVFGEATCVCRISTVRWTPGCAYYTRLGTRALGDCPFWRTVIGFCVTNLERATERARIS